MTDPNDQKNDQENMVARLKQLAFGGLLVVLVVGSWSFFHRGPYDSGLMRYGQVPAFSLIATDKQPYDSSVLDGKVWIASFVFTSCKNSCPMLSAQMRRLSKSLPAGDGFAMLSITVDPDKDTPEVLARYAKDMGATDPRWSFLTGKKAALKSLIIGGFHLSADPGDKALDARKNPDILHSSKLVLVDKHGAIRGYYDGLLGSSADAIRRDAISLSKEP